jgi:hypothetical protein
VSADRDRLAAIRAEHERATHPDWRDVTTVGVLLAEIDRQERRWEGARKGLRHLMRQLRRADAERDRYRAAWQSARRRAAAYEVTDGLKSAVRVALEQHARADAAVAEAGALRDQTARLRAEVLREAADEIDATREGFPIAVWNGITWATAEMRRMAAAAPPADCPVPHRTTAEEDACDRAHGAANGGHSCCGHRESDHRVVMDGAGVFCAACQNAAWHPYRAENTEES